MALSNHTIDIKDQESFWPDVLPLSLMRTVISYYLSSFDELEKLDDIFKDKTSKPFQIAAAKIKPLLQNSLFRTPKESKEAKFDLVLDNTSTKFLSLDACIENIKHLPIEKQIEFLVTAHDLRYENEEKDRVLVRTMKEIQVIFNAAHDTDDQALKAYLRNLILVNAGRFICNSYITSDTSSITLKKNTKTAQKLQQLLSIENGRICGDENTKLFASLSALAIPLIMLITTQNSEGNKTVNLLAGLLYFAILIFCTSKVVISQVQSDINLQFLSTANEGLLRIQEEPDDPAESNDEIDSKQSMEGKIISP